MSKQDMSLASRIGQELNVPPQMIRFYALRMLVELDQERQISNADQNRIYNRASKKTIDHITGDNP